MIKTNFQMVVFVTAVSLTLIGIETSNAAMSVELGTTISCDSQATCKTKCEAIGGTWKRDTTGSTHGTCSLRQQALAELVSFSKGQLVNEKKVELWTEAGDDKSDEVVFLSPSECDALGGDVDYHSGCSGTRLKCTTTDSDDKRHSVCIDEMDREPPRDPPSDK